jgi:peptide/nickel transport system substrate-binding protein
MSNDTGHPTRRQVLAGAAALGGAALGSGVLAACSTSSKSGSSGGTTDKRHQTLFIAGFQWATPTNFNPLNSNACWPTAQNQMQLIYETLFAFNLLDGSLKPQLAASLDMPDPLTINVKLQQGAKWQDGQPVTADDVVFTFQLGKRHEELPYSAAWVYLADVTKTDDQTVKFALNPKSANPGMTKTNLAQVAILPKHVWEGVESQNSKIVEYTNMQPVGSGPYKVDSQNATQVALVRDDNYWGKSVHGKLPVPKFIVHPIYKDNAAGDLAFQNGEVDVMQQFTPQIWKMWQDKKLPVATWYDKPPYHLPGSIPMCVVNTKKKGLDNPKVRRALAFAIDYARIAQTAMSQYSDPANSSVILPKGSESQFFNADLVAKNGWKTDTNQSKQILEGDLGATKGSDGVYKLKDGTRLGPFVMQTPTGWSDWQTALQIVVENAKAAGFDVTAQFPQATTVTTAVQNGNFDLAVWYVAGASPGTPWQRFRDVLDLRGVPAPGTSGYYNYGRFSNADVPGLLDKAATATGDDLKSIFTQLDTIFMANAPMIPLMYRPLEFYEFQEKTWKGFPTSAHPTSPPMFQGAGVFWLYDISPK